MAEPVYDTHDFVQRLGAAGMPEKQAEVLAAENILIMTQVLATKDDLRALETIMMRQFAEVRVEMAGLRAYTETEFATVRRELAEHRAETNVRMTNLQYRVDNLENRLLIRLGGLVIAVQAAALVIGRLF